MNSTVRFMTYRVLNYVKTIAQRLEREKMEVYYCKVLKVFLKYYIIT